MALRWTRELLRLLAECEVTAYRSSGPGGQRSKPSPPSALRHSTGIVRSRPEPSQSAKAARAGQVAKHWRSGRRNQTARAHETVGPSRRSACREEETQREERERAHVHGDE
jgi:protein subunit release factor B